MELWNSLIPPEGMLENVMMTSPHIMKKVFTWCKGGRDWSVPWKVDEGPIVIVLAISLLWPRSSGDVFIWGIQRCRYRFQGYRKIRRRGYLTDFICCGSIIVPNQQPQLVKHWMWCPQRDNCRCSPGSPCQRKRASPTARGEPWSSSTAIHGELQSKQENAQNPSTHDRIYGVQTSKATLEKLSLRDGRRGTRNNRTEHLQWWNNP